MINLEPKENKKEENNKFLDKLTNYLSPKQTQDPTAFAVTRLTEKINQLDATIKEANESSEKLSVAVNKLTSYIVKFAVAAAGAGIIFVLIKFLL